MDTPAAFTVVFLLNVILSSSAGRSGVSDCSQRLARFSAWMLPDVAWAIGALPTPGMDERLRTSAVT